MSVGEKHVFRIFLLVLSFKFKFHFLIDTIPQPTTVYMHQYKSYHLKKTPHISVTMGFVIC